MAECATLTNGNTNAAQSSKKQNVEDALFDPSVEMMVNDFDDERTLEEEEALAAGESEDSNTELSSLQKESEMPLSQLLELYGYGNETENVVPETEDEGALSRAPSESGAEDELDGDSVEHSALQQLYNQVPPNEEVVGSRLLRSLSRPQSEEEEEDYDYSPDEDEWKKTIMVGSDYQASIPEGLCSYDDALPYENDDKLLWDPSHLPQDVIESYLLKVQDFCPMGIGLLPLGKQLKDDEQALFLLQQCGHNTDEALRRIRINAAATADTMSLWSEEECRNFENGLRTFGKNFHEIQQSKVRTRSVGELVQFYYLWKKTERHDVFANKARLEKKKYTLHPGLTDYMDRFLEEQDAVMRERSCSPSVQTLCNDSKAISQTETTLCSVPPDPLAVGEREVFSGLASPPDILTEGSTDTTDQEYQNTFH